MNVLHLGKYDGDVGGIERHVRALLGGMHPGVGVLNLVANAQPISDEHLLHGYRTVRVANHGSLASLAVAPSMPAVARRLHHEYTFDVVHLHFPDPLGQLAAMSLPRSVRRVISWHSDIVKQKSAFALYAPFLRSFVHDADAVIGATPQHFSTSLQMPAGKHAQIREVIPYGFDAKAFTTSDETCRRRAQLLNQHRGRPLIFAVGRHVYYKGFDVLIRAMQDVDADLCIGGRGPLTDSLVRLTADLGLTDKIEFAGFISDRELLAYYEACDVFCMPSTERAEQFGLVQLEAMHCAKPVVATRLGTGVGYVTLDGETGVLVPPKEPDALADALRKLITDDALRTRLGAAGRRRVHEVFSVEQMVRKTVAVYDRVLTGYSNRGVFGHTN